VAHDPDLAAVILYCLLHSNEPHRDDVVKRKPARAVGEIARYGGVWYVAAHARSPPAASMIRLASV
jgi:hypothetical protein